MTKWCKYRGSQGDYKGSLTVLLSAKSQHCLGCQKKHLHLPDISYLFRDLQGGYFCLRVKAAQCEWCTLYLVPLLLTLLWKSSIHSLLVTTEPSLIFWLKGWLTSSFETMKRTSKVVDFNISDHLTKKCLNLYCSLVPSCMTEIFPRDCWGRMEVERINWGVDQWCLCVRPKTEFKLKTLSRDWNFAYLGGRQKVWWWWRRGGLNVEIGAIERSCGGSLSHRPAVTATMILVETHPS